MRLKVIFLGYLRELTQMDQTFSKNLLDNDNISQDTLDGYVNKIKESMNNSLKALRWEEKLNIADSKKKLHIFGSDEDPDSKSSQEKKEKEREHPQGSEKPAPDPSEQSEAGSSASAPESLPEQAVPNTSVDETTVDNKVEEMRKKIMESVQQHIKMSINPGAGNSESQQSLV